MVSYLLCASQQLPCIVIIPLIYLDKLSLDKFVVVLYVKMVIRIPNEISLRWTLTKKFVFDKFYEKCISQIGF